MESWPHAPPHILNEAGVYFVTTGTYLKEHFFRSRSRLELLHDKLLESAHANGWEMHAWAVFSNHYHFVARCPGCPKNLSMWIAKLHHETSKEVNHLDNTPNRKVWHNFRDTRITIHTSYLARLNYVHKNAVKHRIVEVASQYPWCSAYPFENSANKSFVKSVYRFDYNKVNVFDEFDLMKDIDLMQDDI